MRSIVYMSEKQVERGAIPLFIEDFPDYDQSNTTRTKTKRVKVINPNGMWVCQCKCYFCCMLCVVCLELWLLLYTVFIIRYIVVH